MVSPIQIVLNPENFEEARETTGGGERKDFFAFEDAAFRAHKAALNAQVQGIAETLARQSEGDVGYVKVVLRRKAWQRATGHSIHCSVATGSHWLVAATWA